MPLLTADLPGTGGHIRAELDDFRVEELPLYDPSGQGTHTYLWIEKRGIPTMELVHRLAHALGRGPRECGVAGLKDARAVTRQWVSIEHVDPAKAAGLRGDGWQVLRVSQHTNKLRIGHLKGNRFDLIVRGACAGAADRARAVLDRLQRLGMPNHFGPQRFGTRGDTHRLGLAMLQRRWQAVCDLLLGGPRDDDSPAARRFRLLYDDGRLQEARRALPRGYREGIAVLDVLIRTGGNAARSARAVPKNLRRFYVSALQSALFNEVLARRIPDLGRLTRGDLAYLHDRGAVFRVEDAEAEQPRADRLEISPTGPLFGYRMSAPGGEPGRVEADVLAQGGLTPDDFRGADAGKVKGGRRPLRVPLAGADVEDVAQGIRLSFTLPAGCYATTVMAEVTKTGRSNGRSASGAEPG